MVNFLFFIVSLFLVGCATNQPDFSNVTLIDYQCDTDLSFEIGFSEKAGVALLKLTQKKYVLNRVPSASGVKYVLEDNQYFPDINTPITFFGKERSAILQLNKVTLKNCKANATVK